MNNPTSYTACLNFEQTKEHGLFDVQGFECIEHEGNQTLYRRI